MIGRVLLGCLALLLARGPLAEASIESVLPRRWSGPALAPQPEISELQQAVAAFSRGDEDGCLTYLRAARERHPHLPPARLMLARMFLGSGQTVRGRAELERVAATEASAPEIHLTFGELALREGRWSDAEVHLLRAGSLTLPEVWPAAQRDHFATVRLDGLAEVAKQRGQWERAGQILGQALARSSNDALLHYRMARVHFERQDLGACRRQLESAVAADPSLAPVETLLGQFHARAAQPEQAERLLGSAARAHPENAQAQLAYSSWLLNAGRSEAAWETAQAALQADPASRDARFWCGMVQRLLGQPDEAEPFFQAVVDQSPEDREAVLHLAIVLAEQNSPAKEQRALELARSVVQQDPTHREALATLGWCSFQLGRLDDAERLLRTAMWDGKGSAAAAYYLAQVFAARGAHDQARPLLEAVSQAPRNFPYRRAARDQLADSARSEGP